MTDNLSQLNPPEEVKMPDHRGQDVLDYMRQGLVRTENARGVWWVNPKHIRHESLVDKKRARNEAQRERHGELLMREHMRREVKEAEETRCKSCGRSMGCNCHPDLGEGMRWVVFKYCMAPLLRPCNSLDEADVQFLEATHKLTLAMTYVCKREWKTFDPKVREDALDAFTYTKGEDQERLLAAWQMLVEAGY